MAITQYQTLSAALGTSALDALAQQVRIAILVQAYNYINAASPTTAQLAWARQALMDPVQYVAGVVNYIVAEYNDQTVAVLDGSTDAIVQAAVSQAINVAFAI